MNTRSVKTATVLAIAAVFVSVSCASAQPWSKRSASTAGNRQQQSQPDKDRFDEIIKELSLTPEQQQKLAEQRKDEKAQAQQLRQKMQEVRQALSQELDKDKPDRQRVKALIKEMKETIGARIENKVDGILAMKSILTPEQFKKLNEKERPFDFKRGGHHEKDSRNHFDRSRFGRGRSCPKFCQRLG